MTQEEKAKAYDEAKLRMRAASEWSEEDDYNTRILLCLLDYEKENYPPLSSYVQDLEKTYKWLDSLKDRVQPQPKQEWSEEDESKIRHLIAFLDTNPNSVIYSRPKEEWIAWLKSLRLHSQWKPSEEQMAVLNEVINYAANSELQHWSSFIYTLLKSLREELKKLREG